MTNDSSILYITSLLDNPDTITEGDHGSILLYRQTFPYFVPARYMEALELHKEERFSPGMLASMQSYMGNWSLFCDFLEAGVSGKKSAWPVAKAPDAKATDVIPEQVARVTSKKGAGGSVQEQLAAVTPIVVAGAVGSKQEAVAAPVASGSVQGQAAANVVPVIEAVKQEAVAVPVVPKIEIPAVPKLEVPAAPVVPIAEAVKQEAVAAPVVLKQEIPVAPAVTPVQDAIPAAPKQEAPAAQEQQKSTYSTMPKSADTVRREAEAAARNTAASQEAGSRRQEAALVAAVTGTGMQGQDAAVAAAAQVAGGSMREAAPVAEAGSSVQEAVPVVSKIEETTKQDIVIPAPTQRVETIAEMQARAAAEALEMMKNIPVPELAGGNVQEAGAGGSVQEAVAAPVVPKVEIPVTPVVHKQEVPVAKVAEPAKPEVPVAKTVEPPKQEIPVPTPVVTNPVKQAEPVVREIVIPRLSTPPPPRNVPPKQAPAKEKEEPLIQPLYTADYFRQQGEKVSEEIPEEIKEYKAPVNMMTEAEKSLMVMMSFTEWLLHFRDTSARHQEEKKEQKALKTMWQKEKLAAAIEEENDEIPENVFEMAVNSIAKEDGLASESLADIYIKQEKYDKAIEMYRKLSLRNPQKSTYFARKIEEVLKEKQSQL